MEILEKNSSKYNLCDIFLLEANYKKVDAGQLVFGAGKFLFKSRKCDDIGSLKPGNIYITSDDEIKEGDLFIDYRLRPIDIDDIYIATGIDGTKKANDIGKKIIISNDKSLSLPKPDSNFVESYIDRYNSPVKRDILVSDIITEEEDAGLIKTSNKIDKVLVEYEYDSENYDNWNPPYPNKPLDEQKVYKLKVNDDNIASVKLIKENWTREELLGNKPTSFDTFLLNSNEVSQEEREVIMEQLSKWIQLNL